MSTTPDETNEPEQKQRSRRRFLGLLAGGGLGLIAGAGGSLVRTKDASAADGDNLVLGQDNASSAQTKISNSGAIANDAAFSVEAPTSDYGIYGHGQSIGVYGYGPIGVYGDGTVGGIFSGSDSQLSLVARGASGAPTGQSFKGDISLDADGVLWMCIADGTPGTWIKISHGGVRYLESPERVYDSRNTTQKAFSGGETRTIGVGSDVPAQAVGIACNLTVTETTDYGFLSAFPAGTSKPIASNVNWSPEQTVANFAFVKLGTSSQISLYVERSRAQVIVDVAGYVL